MSSLSFSFLVPFPLPLPSYPHTPTKYTHTLISINSLPHHTLHTTTHIYTHTIQRKREKERKEVKVVTPFFLLFSSFLSFSFFPFVSFLFFSFPSFSLCMNVGTIYNHDVRCVMLMRASWMSCGCVFLPPLPFFLSFPFPSFPSSFFPLFLCM